MYRVQIQLETTSDVASFVNTAERLEGVIQVKDLSGHCVNAKSLMGMLYALEFKELWCESEKDIYSHIEKYIV